MDKGLEHILYDKITYDNKTLKQMLLNFNKDADKIYKKYLKDKNNANQNIIYIENIQK